MGFNSPEWLIAFMGAVHANCVASGVYITNKPELCFYQADHSEAELIVVDSAEALRKYHSIIHRLPNLKGIVVYNMEKLPTELKDKRYYTWEEFMQLGKDVKTEIITEKAMKQKPGKCCCLIYTSGTTGHPKGCMITHDNLTWTLNAAILKLIGDKKIVLGNDDRIVSFLPLSHIAGLAFDVIVPLMIGCQLYFARPDALQGSLGLTLQWARPTIFLAVPRVWEKMEQKIKAIGASKSTITKSLAGWAKGLGSAKIQAE